VIALKAIQELLGELQRSAQENESLRAATVCPVNRSAHPI